MVSFLETRESVSNLFSSLIQLKDCWGLRINQAKSLYRRKDIVQNLKLLKNRSLFHKYGDSSTQHPRRPRGQIKGARESLNGRKNIYGTKKSKERREEPLGTMSYQTSSKRSPPFWLLIGARKTQPHFPVRLDCPSSSLSAPGSPRMLKSMRDSNHYI